MKSLFKSDPGGCGMVCCCREIPDGHKYNRYHGLDNIDVLKVICVLY